MAWTKKYKEKSILLGFLINQELNYEIVPIEEEPNGEIDFILKAPGQKEIAVELTEYVSPEGEKIGSIKIDSAGEKLKQELWNVTSKDEEFKGLPLMEINIKFINKKALPQRGVYPELSEALVSTIKSMYSLDLFSKTNEITIYPEKDGRICLDKKNVVLKKYVYSINIKLFPYTKKEFGRCNSLTFGNLVNLNVENPAWWESLVCNNKFSELIADNQNKKLPQGKGELEKWLIIHFRTGDYIQLSQEFDRGIYSKIFFGSQYSGYKEI